MFPKHRRGQYLSDNANVWIRSERKRLEHPANEQLKMSHNKHTVSYGHVTAKNAQTIETINEQVENLINW